MRTADPRNYLGDQNIVHNLFELKSAQGFVSTSTELFTARSKAHQRSTVTETTREFLLKFLPPNVFVVFWLQP